MTVSPFRSRIRATATLCMLEPQIIHVNFSAHSGERGAYRFARSVVTTFANMRQWERKRSDRMQAALNQPLLAVTTYENISCRIVPRLDAQRYEVHFVKESDEEWDKLWVNAGGDVATPDPGKYKFTGVPVAHPGEAAQSIEDVSDEDMFKGMSGE